MSALQFFDAWSLWLCCSEKPSAATLAGGETFRVQVEPLANRTPVVRPWPFVPEHIQLEAAGRWVPVADYRSAQDLAAAPSTIVAIRWELRAEKSLK